MKQSILKYYIFTVIGIILPVVAYILSPGLAGIPGVLSPIWVFVVYLTMRQSKLLPQTRIIHYFKWLLIVVAIGASHAVINVGSDKVKVALLITHLLSWLMISICYMIRDAKSIKYFSDAYLLVLIPTAFISAFTWSGFLMFDVPHILLPLTLFLIIGSFFSKTKSVFILTILFISLIYDSSSRSCLLTIIVCISLYLISVFLPKLIVKRILDYSRILFFITPIVLLLLGVFGNLNIFSSIEEMDVSSYNIESRKSENRLLNTDSRTGVYLDVLNNIEGPSDIILGKGSVITLPSAWTTDRHSVEAEILNVYLRYGLVGCVVFVLLLWKISNKGMYETRNTLTMFVSTYIAYRFMFMFIEDAGLNPIIYVALGICLNPSIRNMTDEQLKKVLK